MRNYAIVSLLVVASCGYNPHQNYLTYRRERNRYRGPAERKFVQHERGGCDRGQGGNPSSASAGGSTVSPERAIDILFMIDNSRPWTPNRRHGQQLPQHDRGTADASRRLA